MSTYGVIDRIARLRATAATLTDVYRYACVPEGLEHAAASGWHDRCLRDKQSRPMDRVTAFDSSP